MAGNVAVADVLIKNGANLTTIDFTNKYVLYRLARKEELLKCLISNGVNFSVVNDDEGLSFLHMAAKIGKNAYKFKRIKVKLIKFDCTRKIMIL